MRRYGDMGTLLFREDGTSMFGDPSRFYFSGRGVTLRIMATLDSAAIVIEDSRGVDGYQPGDMIWTADYEEGITWDE